ncbi:hydroxymethylglutaryl-CoA reductase [Candidatus Gottesmanbacteria bacterium]|nr:hydroxymethylglutaryl-CoA reductase [Candidatus Gottesmanbacteria bacterium]
MNLKNYNSPKERRLALEKELKMSLPHIGHYSLDDNKASTRHCENMIGATQIPLGVAGPLLLQPTTYKLKPKNYFIPLATTEGALVASVNRGCKAITESGGAEVIEEYVGATRGPVFKTSGIKESYQFKNWLDNNFGSLAKVAHSTSSHLTLKKIGTRMVGNYAYVRFYFDTGEAMGMNMVTIATTAIVKLIEQKSQVRCISIAGNFDIDKKPAWLNFIEGKGRRVWAQSIIKKEVIEKVLKTQAQKIHEVWLAKNMLGSIMSGSLGFNAHFANIIAALFLATGQDIAHTVEGSIGITTTEVIERDNLYISIYVPDLMVGTIGGGTGLATQKEALSILKIDGSSEFAKVVGAAVLAGELSLLSSLAEGSLARAHQKLGRGK